MSKFVNAKRNTRSPLRWSDLLSVLLSGTGTDPKSFIAAFLFAVTAAPVEAQPIPTSPPITFEAPARLTDTGVFANAETLQQAPLYKRYEVTPQLWSDCAEKKRWIYVPNGHSVQFRQRGAGTSSEGTVLVKQFGISRLGPAAGTANPSRLETKILWLRGGSRHALGFLVATSCAADSLYFSNRRPSGGVRTPFESSPSNPRRAWCICACSDGMTRRCRSWEAT